jgi:hypothetical protein
VVEAKWSTTSLREVEYSMTSGDEPRDEPRDVPRHPNVWGR